MADDANEDRVLPPLTKEIADAMLGRESDRDARRRELYSDERRRRAEAVEPRRAGAPAALAPWLPAAAVAAGLEHRPADRESAGRSAADPNHAVGGSAHSSPDESRSTHVRPSVPGGEFLEKYARTSATIRRVSSPADPSSGIGPLNDLITATPMPENRRPGLVEPREGMGVGDANIEHPVASEPAAGGRPPSAPMARRDSATRETISRALTIDRSLGDRAIGSTSSGACRSSVQDDGRSPASYSRTAIEPTGGRQAYVGAMAASSDGTPAKEAIGAAAQELERLRSAARRTADELEKVRGPVPPAFPSRPPAFRDRS